MRLPVNRTEDANHTIARPEAGGRNDRNDRDDRSCLRLDNCFRDQAVTNARQLADLLTSADASVVPPGV